MAGAGGHGMMRAYPAVIAHPMRDTIRTLVAAVVAALFGLTVSFTVIDAPRLLASQTIAQVMAGSVRALGMAGALYVPATLVYGGALLALARALKWTSLWAYLAVGLLPAAAYAGHLYSTQGEQGDWLGAFVFHAIPAVLASLALWMSSLRT